MAVSNALPPDKRLAILDDYKAKVPLRSIMERHNVSETTVNRIRRSADVPPQTGKGSVPRITEDAARQFADLLHKGRNQREAAEAVGHQRASLKLACDRYGIKVPRTRTKAGKLKKVPSETTDWFDLPPWERMASFIEGYNGGL